MTTEGNTPVQTSMPQTSSAEQAADLGVTPIQTAQRRNVLRATLIFIGSVAVCLIVYLAATVPGAWFPKALQKAWSAAQLQLTRGAGEMVGDELVVKATDANGIAIVSLTTELPSTDYQALAWIGIDFPDRATVQLLWRTDYAPARMNSTPVDIESGRPLPVLVGKNPAWIGRITGIALAIQGPVSQPLRIRGVVAKPMGAAETVSDRAHEWLAFQGWTGTSINTITSGADVQPLPLPLLLAIAVAVAAATAILLKRWKPGSLPTSIGATVAAFFLVAWLVLDARWMWDLARQAKLTAAQYAGKSAIEKHEAAEDGRLFDFVQQALKVMPAKPARVFVAATAHYFRGRAAYHLYPHSVYLDPRNDTLPAAAEVRPGDWIFVYQRRGIQFSAAEGKLRWDGGDPVSAELKLASSGAALFLIR